MRNNPKKFLVMRHCSVMEDEGRDCFIDRFESADEAYKWILDQTGKYYGPADYYIAKDLSDNNSYVTGD